MLTTIHLNSCNFNLLNNILEILRSDLFSIFKGVYAGPTQVEGIEGKEIVLGMKSKQGILSEKGND